MTVCEATKMTKIFDELMQGMQEILEFEQGHRKLRIDRLTFEPLGRYSAEEIRKIRSDLNMSQRSFASVIGVSAKAVESWESGTNKPGGAASRLLQLFKEEPVLAQKFYTFSAKAKP